MKPPVEMFSIVLERIDVEDSPSSVVSYELSSSKDAGSEWSFESLAKEVEKLDMEADEFLTQHSDPVATPSETSLTTSNFKNILFFQKRF